MERLCKKSREGAICQAGYTPYGTENFVPRTEPFTEGNEDEEIFFPIETEEDKGFVRLLRNLVNATPQELAAYNPFPDED